MKYDAIAKKVESRQWSEVEREWLAILDGPSADPAKLLPILDQVIKAGQIQLGETLGWAWLSTMKEKKSPREALQLGRGLLLRLPDGNQLRDEILALYRETHDMRADIEEWIDRSGLKAGKSVRRALRYLDTGLRIEPGRFVCHRTEDEAAEIVEADVPGDAVTLQTGRRTRTLSLNQLIEDYDVVEAEDFRVMRQLHPDRIAALAKEDPVRLAVGILRSHNNQIDRDGLKFLLVPQFVGATEWSNWWTAIRNATKKSQHLRIEGRSPMKLVYDEAGQSLEQETWSTFTKAEKPREWLEVLEGYLRGTREQKKEADAAFLNRVQDALVTAVERFRKHHEPAAAFATALVIERLAADGLPISTECHGTALTMLREADDPVTVVKSIPDQRLWTLAIRCVEQALPDRWPEVFAGLLLWAPAALCDTLAQAMEKAGRGELLMPIVVRALADAGRHTDTVAWLWKGPSVKTDLQIPPRREMLNLLLGLVGPERESGGRVAGQTVGEMRARIRTALSHRDFALFRESLVGLDEMMGQTVRRQVERAEGLGVTVQDQMLEIVREVFPKLYMKKVVAPWDDETVMYFTETGLRHKEAERDELVNVKMKENAKAIGEAASHGDLSENSEYKFALEERDLLRARLAQVNTELSLARMIDPHEIPSDRVTFGQRVTLTPTEGGPNVVITIGGASDSDVGRRVYSYQTPIAKRVLGKTLKDTARVAFDGEEREFRIEQIENAILIPATAAS